jgi:PAS domain S-box-containing protein
MLHATNEKEISCRVTRTLLMYVREKNGGTLGNFLRGLELDEEYLTDPNNWVSHRFLQILYKRMIELLGDENTVYNMTLSAERFESLGLLDRMVRLLGSPRLIYSQAPKYNNLLKLNGSVFIKELGDSWVLLEDRYHDGSQKTRFDCDYTRGVLAGIPTVFGMPMAHVEEIECQVAPEKYGKRTWPDNPPQGCRGCLYHVRWDPKAKPPFWKRLFQERHYHRQAIEDLQNANKLIQAKYDEVKQLVADLEKTNTELRESKLQLEVQGAELQASEARYRLLADNVTDVIWTMDMDQKFTYYSPSVERITGFTPEEAMARTLRESLTADSYEIAARVFTEELEKLNRSSGGPEDYVSLQLDVTCKDGTAKITEIQTNFLYDDNGRPTGVIGITRDIRDRKRAEQKLKDSEARFKAIHEHSPFAIALVDLKGSPILLNPAFASMMGYTVEELMKMKFIEFSHPEDARKEAPLYQEILEGKRDSYQLLKRNLHKEGHVVWLNAYVVGVRDDSGRLRYMVAMGEDVTEKQNLEKQLLMAQKMESIGNLAKGIAHEFNNVLGIILGNAEMAGAELDKSHPVSESLEEIKLACLRAKDVVKQLLTFSRKMAVKREPINIRTSVQKALKLLRAAIPSSIKIQEVLSAEIDSVVADPTQIHQLLINLCNNAAQAMEESGGTLTIELYNVALDSEAAAKHPDLKAGGYVRLSVRDTGDGIAPEMLDQVFDPYFTTKDVGQGTGMGLAVVHGIVKGHHGAIEIDSTVGEGTVFHIYFPSSTEKPAPNESEVKAPATGNGRILLVDDEISITRIAVKTLRRLGYSVVPENDPVLALERFRSDPRQFDLIITDMTMPNLSGDELVKRAMKLRPDIPVIVCTGYSDRMSPGKARQMGIKGLLLKPVEMAELAESVRKVLDEANDADHN